MIFTQVCEHCGSHTEPDPVSEIHLLTKGLRALSDLFLSDGAADSVVSLNCEGMHVLLERLYQPAERTLELLDKERVKAREGNNVVSMTPEERGGE